MIQQTIQEVKFEDIIISKKQRQARKTNKLRHWLQYLSMLDENKDHIRKNNIIREMHTMFILRQDFWIKEVTRVLNDNTNLNTQSFQFAFMALEDGLYLQVAHLIAQKLFEALNNEKIRINFVIAKLQILISRFDFLIKDGSFFFDILQKVYVKTNNVKKIRQTFQRHISMGFDNYDVTYTEYLNWQQKQLKTSSINESHLLEKGKLEWNITRIFIQDELPKIEISQDFLSSQQIKNSPKNIKRCLFYLEDMNRSRIDEKKYMKLLDMMSIQKQKLWYLRRLALSETHQLVEQYFQCLQICQVEDEDIINAFKMSFNWQDGKKYEMLYLSYLVRRINKHVLKPQSQEYNNQWGSKVQHFRNQISELIEKQMSNSSQKRNGITKLYYYWIDVEMALVKDKATVEQLFESLINWQKTQQIYIDYSRAMIKLGDVSKGKWILNKTFETYGSQGIVAKEYQKFLLLYGSIAEVIKLRKNMGSKALQVKNQAIKVVAHQLNHKQTHKKINPLVENEQNIQSVEQLNHSVQSSQKSDQNQKKSQQTEQHQPSSKRSAPVQNTIQTQHPSLRKKVHVDSNKILFTNKINKNWKDSDIMLNLVFKQHVKQIRTVEKQNDRICYIEFDSQEAAQKQLKQNKTTLNLAFSRPPSKSDDKTLFLCNLPLQTTKEQIKNIIPKQFHQLIQEIRCKEKGDKKTAYIELNSEQIRNQLLFELKRQKIKIGNRSIIALSCSNDHKDNKQKKNKTIFLKNLAFKCKQKDIKNFFSEKGLNQIEQIYIPKDQKTNRPKGYAYIEFSTHQDAEKAQSIQKGQILGRQFIITRSDRAITHNQQQNDSKKLEKGRRQKVKQDNKRSNNFFSNIFS